jgi:hypothetical protein
MLSFLFGLRYVKAGLSIAAAAVATVVQSTVPLSREIVENIGISAMLRNKGWLPRRAPHYLLLKLHYTL